MKKITNHASIIPSFLFRCSLMLLLNASVAQAQAAGTEGLIQYDVELILFEDAHARYINSELWSKHDIDEEDEDSLANDNESTEADVIEDISGLDKLSLEEIENIDKTGEKKLSLSDYENIKPAILEVEYQRINLSSAYNVLHYAAWRQYGLDKDKAYNIDISELANAHQASADMAADMVADKQNRISGTVKVVLTRYLHFYTDLLYQRPYQYEAEAEIDDSNTMNESSPENGPENNPESNSESEGSAASAYQDFPVIAHRRMRSKETHYIDHPLVGMLIQINPVIKKEKPQEE